MSPSSPQPHRHPRPSPLTRALANAHRSSSASPPTPTFPHPHPHQRPSPLIRTLTLIPTTDRAREPTRAQQGALWPAWKAQCRSIQAHQPPFRVQLGLPRLEGASLYAHPGTPTLSDSSCRCVSSRLEARMPYLVFLHPISTLHRRPSLIYPAGPSRWRQKAAAAVAAVTATSGRGRGSAGGLRMARTGAFFPPGCPLVHRCHATHTHVWGRVGIGRVGQPTQLVRCGGCPRDRR